MKEVIKKTNGKKTESLGILFMMFQGFLEFYPDLLQPRTESVITWAIGSGIIPTLIHRYWRNNGKPVRWIKKLFKKK